MISGAFWKARLLESLLEYLMLEFFFSGGYVFYLIESIYIMTFDYTQRQHRSKERLDLDMEKEVPDWETPTVVGRNRRKAHVPLRSFDDKKASLDYWLEKHKFKGSRSGEQHSGLLKTALSFFTAESQCKSTLVPNIFYLTGFAGEPDSTKPWHFSLVGNPNEAPEKWMSLSYVVPSEGQKKWNLVALPHHWQLQGHDIPMYTNTSYPFAFDPPRVRRTGTWKVTDCDAGLGADLETEHPRGSDLHDKEPGENPTGLFRRVFTLPADWTSKPAKASSFENPTIEVANKRLLGIDRDRIFLCFEGVDAAMNVWIDGIYVGYSQDSCLPAEFDVTNILKDSAAPSEHVVCVQVMKWCDGSYLEDQDKWWLSGIYREVYLLRKPAIFISDYEVSVEITESSVNGSMSEVAATWENDTPSGSHTAELTVSVCVENFLENADDATNYSVRAEVYQLMDNSSSKTVFTKVASGTPCLVMTGAVDNKRDFRLREFADGLHMTHTDDSDIPSNETAKSTGCAVLSGTVDSPLLWSAEAPHLYVVVISLHCSLESAEEDTDIFDIESHRFGFRAVGLVGPHKQLGVNGVPIKICGVNRHEFHPNRGRAVCEEDMQTDARLLKKLNFNAVRTSHYPTHPRWLEICDLAGLYVVDEANIETHGFQALGQATAYLGHHVDWKGALMSRVTRMYERDKNCTSVIIWSLGNESGCGSTQLEQANWLRTRDDSRLVQYESGGARTQATDIICPMYQRIGWCRRQALNDPDKRPVILCEYAHAMGNSGGCLKQYWNDFWNDDEYPRFQGGFIWDMIDQGLSLTGNDNDKCYGYGGDFGDLPNSKQFCINGMLGPDRVPHPCAYEAKQLMSPIVIEMEKGEEASAYKNLSQLPVSIDTADTIKRLQLRVLNRRFHSNLSDLRVVSRLRCNLSGPSAVSSIKSATDGLVHVFTPAAAPGEEMILAVGDILCSLLGDANNNKLSKLAQVLAISDNDLLIGKNIFDVWIECAVQTGVETPFVPAGHEVYRSTHIHPEFTVALREIVSMSILLSHNDVVTPTKQKHSKVLVERNVVPAANKSAGAPLLSTETEKDDNIDDVETEITLVTRVTWNSGAYAEVGENCGRILTWCDSNNDSVITKPVELCFHRAPTDNDNGGGPVSYGERWSTVGLNTLESSAEAPVLSEEELEDGGVTLQMDWTMRSKSNGTTVITTTGVLTFFPGGGIEFSAKTVLTSDLPILPRIGLRFCVPGNQSQVQWYGLGPHEAYDDRKACATLGIWESSVESLHVPYVMPGECGRRADPRWVTLGAPNKMALCVLVNSTGGKCRDDDSMDRAEAVCGYGFSASRYSLEQLEQASHNQGLLPAVDNAIYVHIDSKHMGVGGYDSWSPNVDREFQIDAEQYPTVNTNVLLLPYHARYSSGQEIYSKFLRSDL